MNNCRFSPNSNGTLHLGHIFTILFNEQFAHQSGGKFYIRFDDSNQAVALEMDKPERVTTIIESQQNDIEWLGIKVDGWYQQSNLIEETHEIMKKCKKFIWVDDPYPHDMPISVKMGRLWVAFPYAPLLTAERVIMDNMLGITHVIRGDEFLTEYSLYRYFCDIFDIPAPKFVFLPRLEGRTGDISKTNGGYTLAELRANGYNAEYVIDLLKTSCLLWYNNGWTLYNLKENPRINL